MKRYTHKNSDGIFDTDNRNGKTYIGSSYLLNVNDYELKQKLGRYEDLEEDFNIDLSILLTTKKVWCKTLVKNNRTKEQNYQIIERNLWGINLENKEIMVGSPYSFSSYKLQDYGITWAFTSNELKSWIQIAYEEISEEFPKYDVKVYHIPDCLEDTMSVELWKKGKLIAESTRKIERVFGGEIIATTTLIKDLKEVIK